MTTERNRRKPGPRPPPTTEELEAQARGRDAICLLRERDPAAYLKTIALLMADDGE